MQLGHLLQHLNEPNAQFLAPVARVHGDVLDVPTDAALPQELLFDEEGAGAYNGVEGLV